MGKRTTKAEIILKGARERVRDAQGTVDFTRAQLDIATATLTAHIDSLNQLEKDLAVTSRKVKDPKSTVPAVTRRSSRKGAKDQSAVNTGEGKASAGSVSDPVCVHCGGHAWSEQHVETSPDYHLFRTTLKKKDKGNGEIKLPDNPEEFQHGATA